MPARATPMAAAVLLVMTTACTALAGMPVDSVTATLTAKLKRAGRAEVAIERIGVDPLTGGSNAVRGKLALEPPSRAGLEFPETRERLTLREDGGEWLQPEMRQMFRIAPHQASAVFRWWGFLLGDPSFTARRVSDGRWVVRARAAGELAADSAWVTLGPDGLPLRLEVGDAPGSRAIYRFRTWRFMAPRGREAFVIRAPVDYQVLDLP